MSPFVMVVIAFGLPGIAMSTVDMPDGRTCEREAVKKSSSFCIDRRTAADINPGPATPGPSPAEADATPRRYDCSVENAPCRGYALPDGMYWPLLPNGIQVPGPTPWLYGCSTGPVPCRGAVFPR